MAICARSGLETVTRPASRSSLGECIGLILRQFRPFATMIHSSASLFVEKRRSFPTFSSSGWRGPFCHGPRRFVKTVPNRDREGVDIGLLTHRKVMKTPRGAHSQSAAPRLVSAGTSPRGVFNAVGSLPAKIGIVPQPILPIEVQPQEIRQRLDGGEKLILIDVREPSEFAQARIENAELVPMRTVPAELSRLEARTDVGTLIVFCHHGVRSLNVVNWLREQGVDACQSMASGIDRWSLEIDPSVPRYS